MTAGIPSPSEFFSHLAWLDGRALTDVIEPYRRRIFEEALFTFDDGRPRYTMALVGRGKKNWKSADLVLAALYKLLCWPSVQGADGFLLANDEAQAADDLDLAKKLIEANPALSDDLTAQAKQVGRRDGRGVLKILPANDVRGAHGKTASFLGFDEIHAYRNYDLLEALSPDPTRTDTVTWITSYASIYNSPGVPLYDLVKRGKEGSDPRMFFSWYAADYCTDPAFANLLEPEARANPSMATWENDDYLQSQKTRLPSHKYRRLHLNLPGLPDGAAFDADKVMDAIIPGRDVLNPSHLIPYKAFVDMSGGSSDDACLGIAHKDHDSGKSVLDLVVNQGPRPPFNPRKAVSRFVGACQRYGITRVTGDRYAGETFRQDFQDAGMTYDVCGLTKSDLYEAFEPPLNAGEVELLDVPKLQEQMLGLVWRGSKIDHQNGEHDDWSNAAIGAIHLTNMPKRSGGAFEFLV